MTPLADQIVAWLDLHGEATSSDVAVGVHVRRADVIDELHFAESRGLVCSRTDGYGARVARLWSVPARAPGTTGTANRKPSHATKVLAALRSGPKTAAELYSLGVIAHSRIAELRSKGYVITCDKRGAREAKDYLYTLVSEPPLETAAGAQSAAVSSDDHPPASLDPEQLVLGAAA